MSRADDPGARSDAPPAAGPAGDAAEGPVLRGGPEADGMRGGETGGEANGETGMDARPDTDPETASDAGAGLGADTSADTGSDTGPETDPETGPDVVAGAMAAGEGGPGAPQDRRAPDDWEIEDEPEAWEGADMPDPGRLAEAGGSVWLAPRPAPAAPPEPPRRKLRRRGAARPPVRPAASAAPPIAASAAAGPRSGPAGVSAQPKSALPGSESSGSAPSGSAPSGSAPPGAPEDRSGSGAGGDGSGMPPTASPVAPPAPGDGRRGPGVRAPEGLRDAPLTLVGPVGRIGAAASLALLALMLLWAQVSVIGGAVIGSGEVVVRGQPKEVQSLDGGVVAAILTREGARVEAGEVLMRLDPTIPQIELDIREGRLADAVLRQRRLEAEYAGADRIDFEGLPPRVAARDLAREREGQEAVFAARLAVLESRRDGLAARAEAAEEEIAATEARISDLEGRLGIARGELERTRGLVDQGLAARAGLAEAEARVSSLTADLASERVRRQQADAGIREARLAVVEAERRFREEAVTELREASLEREQLLLDIARLEKDIARAELVAPADGIVHDLRVATEGGVVGPGERVMQIVPVGEGVEFAVRVDPRAIDEVHVGQPARLVLPAFGGAAAPELSGRVAQVPPAARTDPQTGLAHYLLSVEVEPGELARLGGGELVPGMPVEAFLATAERSVLAYLLGPLTEQLRRAFREG